MAKTLGQHLLEQAIPEGYRPDGVYTKKVLFNKMVSLAKDNPEQYTQTISQIKKLGDEFSTMEGISVGLDDIQPQYHLRDSVTRPALEKMKKAKTRDEKVKIVAGVQDALIQQAINHPGTMGDMARSGSRGNALQLMRAVAAPAAAADEHDNIQPWLTVRSYAEGLRPSEWWAAGREARMAAVKSSKEVSDPGAASKILLNNLSDQIITKTDCGTHNGLDFSVDDNALLDRFLAKPVDGFSYNELITPRVIATLKQKKITHVIARSPMTCESDIGVCQHCMGLDVTGKLNKIGQNVGIRAGHAIGEPLTQLALNAKHGVRVSGENPMDLGGLQGLNQILETPAHFRNKAALAPVAGKIEHVTAAPQGGHYIGLAGQNHYVTAGLKPLVAKGDHVHAGDVLSEGIPKPDEVVHFKGLGAGRNYLVDKLQGIYRGAGVDIDRRHLEVVAKSTLNHLQVDHVDDKDMEEHGLIRGDYVDYNKFRAIVADSLKSVPVKASLGKNLGEGTLYHLAGTIITEPMIKEFQRAGIQTVKVTMKAPRVTPIMVPATRNPLLNPDWAVRLGHRLLKQSLLEGAHEAQTSNIHGAHPVPGLLFSTEFGEGEDGQY